MASLSEDKSEKRKSAQKGLGIVPEAHSAVRHVLADVHGVTGTRYRPLNSYEEARTLGDAYVVMEGDWGGQIYLVTPMRLVTCQEETLRHLLMDLDDIGWPTNDSEGTGLYYERYHIGQIVPGGMGGGKALDDLWVHGEFAEYGIQERIRAVLSGKLPQLGLTQEELQRIRELDKARIDRRLKEISSRKS